eukprot:751454-Amphidinium_carterae.1
MAVQQAVAVCCAALLLMPRTDSEAEVLRFQLELAQEFFTIPNVKTVAPATSRPQPCVQGLST